MTKNTLGDHAIAVFLQALATTIWNIDNLTPDDRHRGSFVRVFDGYLDEVMALAEKDGLDVRKNVGFLPECSTANARPDGTPEGTHGGEAELTALERCVGGLAIGQGPAVQRVRPARATWGLTLEKNPRLPERDALPGHLQGRGRRHRRVPPERPASSSDTDVRATAGSSTGAPDSPAATPRARWTPGSTATPGSSPPAGSLRQFVDHWENDRLSRLH